MTNQERYTIIEAIYQNGGVMVIDVAADGTISSQSIEITDGAELFIILLAVAAGMNDVDTNLFTKLGVVYDELTTTLPTTLNVDLKAANSNTDSDVDAHKFFTKPVVYDNGTDPPQTYNINSQVAELMVTNTVFTRINNSSEMFPYFEQYRTELLLDSFGTMFPDNYVVFHEATAEYLIVPFSIFDGFYIHI